MKMRQNNLQMNIWKSDKETLLNEEKDCLGKLILEDGTTFAHSPMTTNYTMKKVSKRNYPIA